MTTDLAISLLKSGDNGEQILRILDSIAVGNVGDEFDGLYQDPTLDAIDF
jgi:hypothetical protein